MTKLSTLCHLEKDGKYLMLHRTVKKHDVNKDKWIGVGGHFEPDESPEECVIREVYEETGYRLTSWQLKGLVTFVSGGGETEYMHVFTADGFEGTPHDCDEGELAWVRKEDVIGLNIWEGDKIFLRLMEDDEPFFSLKLVYNGTDRLVYAALNGRELELFDQVDEKGEPTGLTVERGVAHRLGVPHRTAHIWITRINEKGERELLLQKRADHKDSYPGCTDISSAGHVTAGDEVLPSALREMQEELGITAEPADLEPAGVLPLSFDEIFYGKPFRDKEYANLFIYRKPVDIKCLHLQESEVSAVIWVPIEICKGLADGSLTEADVPEALKAAFPTCLRADEIAMVADYLEAHP